MDPARAANDKDDDVLSASCAKLRALTLARAPPIVHIAATPEPPPPGSLPPPAAIAEAAEVDAVLDAWARGPPTPPASQELRRAIKRARSTSDTKDSPTP